MVIVLGSCTAAMPSGDIRIDIIGDGSFGGDNRGRMSSAAAVIASATAMGLVAIDGAGQVEPALGESWITTADGLSTIFRIRRAQWRDGREATGEEVAASLNRAASDGRNRLMPMLTAVESVVGMTGRVVEIRLKAPRPNLLQLFAQPEMGVVRNREGLGPYRVDRRSEGIIRLTRIDPDDGEGRKRDAVVVRSERAARGVARFVAGDLDWLGGGTLADLPIVRVARTQPGRLRLDPIEGLFGLAVVGRSTFVDDPEVRAALSMSVDRKALSIAVGLPGWNTTEALLPGALDSAQLPARPAWANIPLADRQTDARRRIERWRGSSRTLPVVKVALPEGPGMRLLFASLADDWASIGLRAQRVAWSASDADLRLIDAVAPNSSANWYLTSVSCAAGLVCDPSGDAMLEASRNAPTLAQRSARLADTDAIIAMRGSFIALGAPVRWSLVQPTLTGWRENIFGIHPLNELRPIARN